MYTDAGQAEWGVPLRCREECELMLTRFETELASIFDGAGDAGSPTDIERVVLRDGSRVVIRPLAANDEAAIASWFAGLGAETRYARFSVVLERLDRRTQAELARVDHFASMLLERFAARARSVGREHFIAMRLVSNHTVIRLLSRLGPTAVGPSDSAVVELRIDPKSRCADRCASEPASGDGAIERRRWRV